MEIGEDLTEIVSMKYMGASKNILDTN